MVSYDFAEQLDALGLGPDSLHAVVKAAKPLLPGLTLVVRGTSIEISPPAPVKGKPATLAKAQGSYYQEIPDAVWEAMGEALANE